ncbi:hypothetical protein C7999DRAFT_36352 [Corynascus novoguineensis]|uniref:Uncharacterized protein n=1 Tax=Corynascus novoguineensis TaxID=1126955 RepID=A0AAN7CJM2_9PEZI|nr:hypothetical protein C7999DRAFT_36352 [Corynascus novoguineensis]
MSRVIQMPPPPPLLLTKRVTSFLRANLSPIIHSAMLTTPAGSLLAHASSLPASALRRQAAVAASLWALQGRSNAASTPADPATASLPPGSTVRTRKSGKHAQPTVTVQLDSGAVFVIRRLRCGMLFICMGGSEGGAASSSGKLTPIPSAPHLARLNRSPASATPSVTEGQPPQAQAAAAVTSDTAAEQPASNSGTATDPSLTPRLSALPQQPSSTAATGPHPSLPPAAATTTATTATTTATATTTTITTPPASQQQASAAGSPSQASVLSAHTTGAASTTSTATGGGSGSVSVMRRHVEELARWLDERLGGLCVPEEGIGIGIGSGNGVAAGYNSNHNVGGGSGHGAMNGAGNGLDVR